MLGETTATNMLQCHFLMTSLAAFHSALQSLWLDEPVATRDAQDVVIECLRVPQGARLRQQA